MFFVLCEQASPWHAQLLPALDAIEPEKHFGMAIEKVDVVKFEHKLKAILRAWAAHGSGSSAAAAAAAEESKAGAANGAAAFAAASLRKEVLAVVDALSHGLRAKLEPLAPRSQSLIRRQAAAASASSASAATGGAVSPTNSSSASSSSVTTSLTKEQWVKQFLPFLMHLHHREWLPAIVFAFDPADCELLCETAIKELERLEREERLATLMQGGFVDTHEHILGKLSRVSAGVRKHARARTRCGGICWVSRGSGVERSGVRGWGWASMRECVR